VGGASRIENGKKESSMPLALARLRPYNPLTGIMLSCALLAGGAWFSEPVMVSVSVGLVNGAWCGPDTRI
jgi:hypothetical protein